jgi:uncharacterized membrane protein (UPF0127 family)
MSALPVRGEQHRPPRAVNVTQGIVLAERLDRADTFLTRLKGLLGRTSLPPGDGLFISHCTSVHSIGMAFAIDVLHLDKHGRVKRVLANMKPGRVGPWVPGGASVLELPAGACGTTHVGDQIEIG